MQRPSKRRRPNVPDSAGLDWAASKSPGNHVEGLEIQGMASTIFQQGPDPEQLVMPWPADPEVTVDRFDGRLLLDSISAPLGSLLVGDASIDIGSPSQEEIDAERYADLAEFSEAELSGIAGWFLPSRTDSEEIGAEAHISSLDKGSFQAVGLNYDNDASEETPAASAAQEQPAVPFQPPFQVIEGMELPSTEQMHKIISHTAQFVRGAGRQSVFVLRVKQAANPNFAFLMPDHSLHPYFQWLVDEYPEGKLVTSDEDHAQSQSNSPAAEPKDTGTGLGLLSSYSSDTPKAGENVSPFNDSPKHGACPDAAETSELAHHEQDPPEAQTEAAEIAASQRQRSHPLPETEAVMQKLVAFVKKNGVKFEASVRRKEKDNPLFSFLHAKDEHHTVYREKLIAAIGKEEAEAVLPRAEVKPVTFMTFNTKPTPSRRPVPHDSSSQKSKIEASANRLGNPAPPVPVKSGSIRANPAVVRVVTQPMTEEKALAAEKAARQSPGNAAESLQGLKDMTRVEELEHGPAESIRTTADAASTAVASIRAEPSGQNGAASGDEMRNIDKGWDAAILLEDEIAPQEKSAAKLADEAKKAQRRELARKLLMEKQPKAGKGPGAAGRIVNHRSAFMDEDDMIEPEGPPEAGEIQDGPSASSQLGFLEAAPALPKLEELLRAKQPREQPVFNEVEVLSPQQPKKHARHSKKARSGNSKRKSRGKHAKRRRRSEASSTSSSDSENVSLSSEEGPSRAEQRKISQKRGPAVGNSDASSDSASMRRRSALHRDKRKQKEKRVGRHRKVRQHAEKKAQDPKPEDHKAGEPDIVAERVRAMLRGS